MSTLAGGATGIGLPAQERVRAEVAALAPEARGVCVFLGDMPLVPVGLCAGLAQAASEAGYAARPLFDSLPPAAIVDGFGLDIYGAFYGDGVNPGQILSSGQAYIDNLSVSAVPEPSTYAAFAGLGALGRFGVLDTDTNGPHS